MLKPVSKMVLNCGGVSAETRKPTASAVRMNPLLKPLLKSLLLNGDPNGLVNPLVGKDRFA